jgi:hypothetical protein
MAAEYLILIGKTSLVCWFRGIRYHFREGDVQWGNPEKAGWRRPGFAISSYWVALAPQEKAK